MAVLHIMTKILNKFTDKALVKPGDLSDFGLADAELLHCSNKRTLLLKFLYLSTWHLLLCVYNVLRLGAAYRLQKTWITENFESPSS